jgi:starvation-inducible DNA-binding protein
LTQIYDEMIGRMRQRAREVEPFDQVTNTILVDITQDLEKQHWMWRAQGPAQA